MVRAKEFEACGKQYTTRVAFESISSQYSLFCTQAHSKELAEALTLFLSSLVSSVFIFMQSRFGSKHTIISAFAGIGVPGFACVVLIDRLVAKVTGIMLLWSYTDIMISLGPVYASELLVEPFRSVSNSVFRIMYVLGGIFGTWMTLHLRDYRLIVSLYFAGYLVINTLLLFALPQSPSYLLKQKQAAKLAQTVTRIAVINRFAEDRLGAVLANLERIVESRIFR